MSKTESSGSVVYKVTSPYHLSSSDNPGALISPVLLTGDNYAEWVSELENALRAKRKLGFVDGTLQKPNEETDPVDAKAWNTVNSMIVGWIRASISPTIRSTVPFAPNASKLWSNLKQRFPVGNAVRIHQIKSELAACTQDGMTVMEYFGKLSSKWEELLAHKPMVKCTCAAAEMLAKEYEEEKVHQFLLGLDDARFGNVCTNIIGLDTLPDLNTVYQRVVREERRLATSRVEPKQSAIGFTTKTEKTATAATPTMESLIAAVARTRPSVVCTNCGRNGHDKKDCWQLIGFPEWFTERNQGGSRGRGTSTRGRGRGRQN